MLRRKVWDAKCRAQNVGVHSIGAQNVGVQSMRAQSVGVQSVGEQSVGVQSLGRKVCITNIICRLFTFCEYIYTILIYINCR